MKNSKWGVSQSDDPIVVVLFISRNKDNKDLSGFKERRKSFVSHLDDDSMFEMYQRFKTFVSCGVSDELCRLYISVNARNNKNVTRELAHFLIDNPDFDITALESKAAGIAAKRENALTHYWMFDCDNFSPIDIKGFIKDIEIFGDDIKYETIPTPHGYSVIVNHGFDTRELMRKWNDPYSISVTLKRDDVVCVEYRYSI